MMNNKYIVWKRSPDGFISCSAGHFPLGWIQPSDGVEITFKKLGEFYNWHDAYNFIISEREKSI